MSQARYKAGYLRGRKRGNLKAVTRSLLALEYREHKNYLMLQLVVSNIPALNRQLKDWGQSGAGGGPSPAAEQARNVLQLVYALPLHSSILSLHKIALMIFIWCSIINFAGMQGLPEKCFTCTGEASCQQTFKAPPASILLSLTVWKCRIKTYICIFVFSWAEEREGVAKQKQTLQIILNFNGVVETTCVLPG